MKSLKTNPMNQTHRSSQFLSLKWLYVTTLLISSLSWGQSNNVFVSNNRSIDVQEFDKQMEAVLLETGVPAVSLAIIENDQIVYTNAYGYSDVNEASKADQKTLFEICSLSKIYLLYAVMKLSEEKKIDLDKPLYKYLPNERLAHDDRYKLITSKMIINHTSGIENWYWFNNPDQLEILHDPGSTFEYSGEGYDYLAEVLTEILNESYESYINRIVLEPLKLTDNIEMHYDPKESNADFSTGYNMEGQEIVSESGEVLPASSIITTAQDFSNFLLLMLDKKHLSSESVDYILQDAKVMADFGDAGKMAIGNGFINIETPEDKYIGFLGSNKGFKAQLFYSVKSKRGFVYMSNSDIGDTIAKRLNTLTTQFAVYDFIYPMYFAPLDTYISLRNVYENSGESEFFSILDAEKENIDWSNMDVLLDYLYKEDMTSASKLANVVLENNPESAIANFINGAVNLRYHRDYEMAKKYFLKAQELEIEGVDIDFYLEMCAESGLSKRY